MNISRQRSYLTGQQGNRSTDQIKGQNELNMTDGFNSSVERNYFGNYTQSYQGGINGSVHLGQPEYINPRNTIHDNLGARILAEQIFDNRLLIDSSLRDYTKHNDPFKFIVKFNAIEPKTENVTVSINGDTYSYTKYLEGDTTVIMDRIFKNIKAIIINTLVLPRSIEYVTKENGSYEKSGKTLAKSHYKYILLKIEEVTNCRTFSNNKAFGREFFVMKIDDESCVNFHRWIPISNNISYPDSRLNEITRLTVEICDDNGDRLCPKLDGKPFDFYADYQKTIDKVIMLQKKGDVNGARLLKPKLDSLKDIVTCISPELHLTICTLEPQINTLPQYRY